MSAYAYRGDAFICKEQYEKALADLTQVIQLCSEESGLPISRGSGSNASWAAVAHTKRALVHILQGDIEKALADLNEAIRLDPRQSLYRGNRCNLYMLKGEFDKASADLIAWVSVNAGIHSSTNKEQIPVLVDFQKKLNVKYLELVRCNPKNAKTHIQRGWFYSSGGDLDKGLAELNDSIRLDPTNAFAHVVRGMAYLQKSEPNSAMSSYSEAIRLCPECTVAHYLRGLTYGGRKEYDRAIADFTEVIRVIPTNAASLCSRGRAFRLNGDVERAIVDLTSAINIDPDEAVTYAERAKCYAKLRQYDKGIADCCEAIRRNPRCPLVYDVRGYIYGQKGEHEKAITDWTESLRLDPQDSYARQCLNWARAAVERRKNPKQWTTSESKQDWKTRHPGLNFFRQSMHLDSDLFSEVPSALERRTDEAHTGKDTARSKQSPTSENMQGSDWFSQAMQRYSKPNPTKAESQEYDPTRWLREAKSPSISRPQHGTPSN